MKTLSIKYNPVAGAGCTIFILRNYFLTGFLLHLITLVSSCLAVWLGHVLFDNNAYQDQLKIFFLAWIFSWLVSVTILSQLDAWSRYQEYKLMKDLIYRYGLKHKFLRAMRHSRCQRDAAFVAADSLGFGPGLKRYFKLAGYRWYHLLPDFLVIEPIYMASWHFWKTTFFSRYYSSKYFTY